MVSVKGTFKPINRISPTHSQNNKLLFIKLPIHTCQVPILKCLKISNF